MRYTSLLLAISLLASCQPAMAQSVPTDNTTNPSGSQRIQGTGAPNRGDPVNVRNVTCTGGTCVEVAAGGGGGGSTPTGAAGSPNANVVTVQGITGGTPQNVQYAATPTFNLGTAPTLTVNAHAVTQPDVQGTGTIAAGTLNANYTVAPANTNGAGTLTLQITGLAGGTVLTPYTSFDGTTYTASGAVMLAGTTGSANVSTITADGRYRMTAAGVRGLRLAVTTAGTGTVTVTSTLTVATSDPLSPAQDSTRRLLPAQGVPVTVAPIAVSASTITLLSAAAPTRIGFSVQLESASTAITYLCANGQSTTCSATVHDAVIPSSATIGTEYFFSWPSAAAYYVFSTAAVTITPHSVVAQ